jgi:hypothetical protein
MFASALWRGAPLIGLLLLLAAGPATGQIYELPRPDTSETKTFGVSVAIDGNVAVVGASGEEASCGENAGAAYVYERSEAGGVWSRVARLTPDECRSNAFFGERVGIDAGRIIVSASSEFFAYEKSNAAYIYERNADGAWTQTARLTRPVGMDQQEGVFAAGVALDGDRAAVTTSGDVDGTYGGAVYVFDYNPEQERWRRTARLTSPNGVREGVLGGAVDLDGDRLAVAASTYFERDPGSVYIFRREADGAWASETRVGGVRDFFISLDLDGRMLVVGESRGGDDESGRATVHRLGDDGMWEQVTTLYPSTPYEGGAFGSTVSVNGDWILVTGYDEQLGQDFNIDRVVYAFRKEGDGTWKQRTIIDIGQVAFGADIDQDDETAIISSVPETEDGSVYVVRLQ